MTSSGERYDVTRDQKTFLDLLFEGLPQTEIARRMGIGESSANMFCLRLKRKFGAETLAGLVREALAFGLLEPPKVVARAKVVDRLTRTRRVTEQRAEVRAEQPVAPRWRGLAAEIAAAADNNRRDR
jgi:DNA-binding CsgD family transcriptional regulator